MQRFDSMKVRAWNGLGLPEGFNAGMLLDSASLFEPQETDTMFCMYRASDGSPTPRLAKAALSFLKDIDEEPVLTCIAFDVDNPGHAPWPDNATARAAGQRALDLIDAATLNGKDAFALYTTRAGFRVVAMLGTPVPVSKGDALLAQVGAGLDIAWCGEFEVDPVSYQWTRLFRLPRALRAEGAQHTPEVFPSYDEYGLTPEYIESLPESGLSTAIDADMPLDAQELTLDDWVAAYTYHRTLRYGLPIPEDVNGSSYFTLKRWLATIAARGRITDPTKLVSYVWRSVQATPKRDVETAWKLALWVCEQQLAEEQEEYPEEAPLNPEAPHYSEWDAVAAHFTGHDAKLLQRLKDGRTLSSNAGQYEDKTIHAVRLLAEAGIHNPADLHRMVWPCVQRQKKPLPPVLWELCTRVADEERNRSASDMDDERKAEIYTAVQPLTVHYVGNKRLWQLNTITDPPSYFATDKDSLPLHYAKFTLPGLPFEADYDNPHKNFPDILLRYGATVNKLAYVSGMQGCVYDPRGSGAMLEGVHTLAPCKAVYHEDVDGWLRCVGGESYEKLLDWLAAVTLTSAEPTCALYINGSPGDGKSLLARGISSMWGARHTDYAQVMSEFNAKLLDCPLVFADEGITVGRFDEYRASEFFRNLVSEQGHAIRGLYREAVDLRGSVRVLICANDEDGIPFRKALGQDGLEAIVQRILYIRSGRVATPKPNEPRGEAGAYIKAIGGRAHVTSTGWVREDNRPGRLAEHFAYLRETRAITRGSRFIVEGERSDWHNQFVATQGYKPAILQVADYMLRRADAAGGAGFIRRDDIERVVWVHQVSIVDTWKKVVDAKLPKHTIIQRTIKQMASEDSASRQTFGSTQVRCWPIPFEAFIDAAVWEVA